MGQLVIKRKGEPVDAEPEILPAMDFDLGETFITKGGKPLIPPVLCYLRISGGAIGFLKRGFEIDPDDDTDEEPADSIRFVSETVLKNDIRFKRCIPAPRDVTIMVSER